MRANSKGNNSTRPNIGRKNCKYNRNKISNTASERIETQSMRSIFMQMSRFMSKNSKAGQRACRQQKPTKIVVESHYVGTEKMETVFKRIAEEQITKKVKDMAQSNAS